MSSSSWQDRLDDASNVHDVVEVARDFLASWDRHEIAALPEECRPGKIFDANDITSYAFQLVRHDCESNAQAAPFVHKMAAFFSGASVRLSQILSGVAETGDDDSRQSA
jgi:hypothetical protein